MKHIYPDFGSYLAFESGKFFHALYHIYTRGCESRIKHEPPLGWDHFVVSLLDLWQNRSTTPTDDMASRLLHLYLRVRPLLRYHARYDRIANAVVAYEEWKYALAPPPTSTQASIRIKRLHNDWWTTRLDKETKT